MPSKAYDNALAQMREFHRLRKTFSGNGVLKHAKSLIVFSHEIEARSAIDYGCGKGQQYTKVIQPYGEGGGPVLTLEQHLGYVTTKYDPAWPEFEKPPAAPADLVWCVDVLECIPEEDMDMVIDDLFRLALKGLFVTVASYPAKKTLPNGENAHLTIKPEAWWRQKFNEAMDRKFTPDSHGFELLLLVA